MPPNKNKTPRDAKEFKPWQDMDGSPRIYGCEYCHQNILGEPYQPTGTRFYNFCDESHYELWHARQ